MNEPERRQIRGFEALQHDRSVFAGKPVQGGESELDGGILPRFGVEVGQRDDDAEHCGVSADSEYPGVVGRCEGTGAGHVREPHGLVTDAWDLLPHDSVNTSRPVEVGFAGHGSRHVDLCRDQLLTERVTGLGQIHHFGRTPSEHFVPGTRTALTVGSEEAFGVGVGDQFA